jgi:RecG-like helicase
VRPTRKLADRRARARRQSPTRRHPRPEAAKTVSVADLLLRYEDETRVTPVARAPWGEPVQVEVVVSSCEVQFRPRRQMVVRALDASGELTLRFFSFYPGSRRRSWPGAGPLLAKRAAFSRDKTQLPHATTKRRL